MLRHVVGGSAPAIALAGLFVVVITGANVLAGVIVSVVVGALVGVAAELHVRLAGSSPETTDRSSYTFWILPFCATVSIGLAIANFQGSDPLILRSLPVVGAIGAGLAVLAQTRENAAGVGWRRGLIGLLTYVVAFVLFTLIYQTKERSLVTATVTAVTATLLAVVLMRAASAPRAQILLYAIVVGLCAGEVIWALNYWVVVSLTGGAVLLVFFYVFVGVADGVLNRELNRRLLLEYVLVGLLGFLLTLSTAPWRP